MRSFSPTNRRAGWAATACLLPALMLAGCARPAPPLPPETSGPGGSAVMVQQDFTPHDLAMTCGQISEAYDWNMNQLHNQLEIIRSHRWTNDTIPIAAWIVPVVIIPVAWGYGIEPDDVPRERADLVYQRNDTLIRLADAKHCPDWASKEPLP